MIVMIIILSGTDYFRCYKNLMSKSAELYIDEPSSRGRYTGQIKIHHREDFEGMKEAGQIAAMALDMLVSEVRPDVLTSHLDDLVYQFAMDHDALPATLNYRGFTHSCCISINHVICHGIPGARRLKEGDMLNIDITLIKDGWHGDTSRMFFAGAPSRKSERLVEITFEAMWHGIRASKPGATTGDIGWAIESYVHDHGMSVVRDFSGHGLGRVFHDAPNIMHYGQPGTGATLRPGMFFTIEPMVNLGKAGAKILSDGWTAVTRDRSLSAQFEHSVGITETGCEVFTLSPQGLDKPPYGESLK